MSYTYERKSERKFCYFIKDYVDVVFVVRRHRLEDGTYEVEERGLECPRARKCRKEEHNCCAIHPKRGIDPFIPFTNLLEDMW